MRRAEFPYDLGELFLQVWRSPEVQLMLHRNYFSDPNSVAHVLEILSGVIDLELNGAEKDRLILLSLASEFMLTINQTQYIMSVLEKHKSQNLPNDRLSFDKTVQMYPTHLVDSVLTLFNEWSEKTGIQINIYVLTPERPSQQSRFIVIGTDNGHQPQRA